MKLGERFIAQGTATPRSVSERPPDVRELPASEEKQREVLRKGA